MSDYTVMLTNREYDALKGRVVALNAALIEALDTGRLDTHKKYQRLFDIAYPCSGTSAKYGTCPECDGQGGAHFPACIHSPAKIETVCNVVDHQIIGKCPHCGNEMV